MYKKSGVIIALFNLLVALLVSIFFLFIAKTSIIEWIFFNACSPAIALYLVGYFSRNKIIMFMSIPALSFFGFEGLLNLGWTTADLFSLAVYILMLGAVIWMVYGIFKNQEYKEATIGLILAAVFINMFIAVQQSYAFRHGDRLQQVMNGRPW